MVAIIVQLMPASSKLYTVMAASLSWPVTCGFIIGYIGVAAPAVAGTPQEPAFVAASLLLGSILILLSVIDVRFYRLPDALTFSLLATGLALCFVFQWDDVRWRLAAAAFGFGTLYGVNKLYHYIRARDGLGPGDAKLLAAAGAWLGMEGVPTTLLIASLSGLGAALLSRLAGRPIAADTRLPFGPFLALGTWLTWFYGPMI